MRVPSVDRGGGKVVGLYSRWVLPHLIHLACGLKPVMRQREKVVPLARGRVLEVGIGSGLNLPYYDRSAVEKVYGLDPSPDMTARAERAARSAGLEVEFIHSPAESIPLGAGSVDTVVVTYTLCTIPQPVDALREMRRILRRGGNLLFCEHGVAPDANVRKWQRIVDPVWTRLAGGCHLDRDIPGLLAQGGFNVTQMDTMYLPGWRPATFNYWGSAQ